MTRRLHSIFAVCAALVLLALGGCEKRPDAGRGPSVLLVVLDTVRFDHLSCYGYEKQTTPMIDHIAEGGVRFENCYANAPWTLSSHASLFTGMYPVGHRATQETLELSGKPPTLAQILGGAGYETFGASANPVVSVKSGLARGFGEFEEVFRARGRKNRNVHPNNAELAKFLESADPDRPFFAFLNYVEAHAPYQPYGAYRMRFVPPGSDPREVDRCATLRMVDYYGSEGLDEHTLAIAAGLYDGEINFLDDQMAALMETLKASGRAGETVVVITSDHGENLGDHGHFGHVFNVYNTLLHVPLIVVFPDGTRAGAVEDRPVEVLDLFPTILSLCGVEYRGRMDGRNLFGESEGEGRTLLAEYYYPRQALSVFQPEAIERRWEHLLPFMRRTRAIQDGTFKLIWGSDGKNELYRVDRDPGETQNLLADDPDHPEARRLTTEMERRVELYAGDTPLGPVPPPGWMVPGFEEKIDDPALLEKLRSLGYIK